MAAQAKIRIHPRHERALDLPPPFRLVTLREVGDAHAHALLDKEPEASDHVLVVVHDYDSGRSPLAIAPRDHHQDEEEEQPGEEPGDESRVYLRQRDEGIRRHLLTLVPLPASRPVPAH